MMGMVAGVLDRLRLSQSADGQDTEHQEDRQKFEDGVAHEHTTECDTANATGYPENLSDRLLDTKTSAERDGSSENLSVRPINTTRSTDQPQAFPPSWKNLVTPNV